ncbi:MAG: hypothetical protein N3A69_06000 [Leptospiraceae bacterium]|nr:hypothetical protein [Leptospiraceae bacterium]
MEQQEKNEKEPEYNTQIIKALKDQAEEVDGWLDRLKKMLFQAENEEPIKDPKQKKNVS